MLKSSCRLLPLLLLLSCFAEASDSWFCKSSAQPRLWQFGNVKVSVARIVEPQTSEGYFCRVQVVAGSRTILKKIDFAIEEPRAVRDTNGDGYRDLVIEGYSGGAHCCWTYWLVTLSPRPTVVLKLENERSIEFGERVSGRTVIAAQDGIFDYFRASHAGTYFPEVFLELKGTTLRDISPEFRDHYDNEIQQGLRALTPRLRRKLISARSDEDYLDDDDKYPALQVILAYLYSGREVEAWAAVQELWPAYDREKLKQEILRNRRNGLLRYTRSLRR